MAYTGYYNLYGLGYFSTCNFFSTLMIKYVSLSDLQALFYRQVLFVEKKFHCELVLILLYEKNS